MTWTDTSEELRFESLSPVFIYFKGYTMLKRSLVAQVTLLIAVALAVVILGIVLVTAMPPLSSRPQVALPDNSHYTSYVISTQQR